MAFNDWTKMPFDQAVQVNPSVPLRRGYVYPFVDMQAVDPNSRSVTYSEIREFKGGGSRFISGDTLMARITPCLENGKIARYLAAGVETLGHGSTEFIVIRGKEKVTDNGFAYYLTKWEGVHQFCISQMTGSSGRQRVPTIALSHCEVSVPPIKEQQAIAQILGALDDKIELIRRMNKTLEEMARAIFKSWFVDFLPVRAKMAARTQTGDPVRLTAEASAQAGDLAPEIAALFPDSFDNSELGEIPKGWKVLPLSDAMEVNPPRPLRKGEVAPYLDMANMPTQGPAPDIVINRPFNSGMRFINGDTLVARITPCLENGKTAFVDFLNKGQVGWGSTEYIVLHPKPPLPDEYAYCLARSDDFREFAIQSMTGSSGRQRVPAEALSHYHVVLPSKQIAGTFGKIVDPLFARIKMVTCESRALSALRDTLLPKLISGELRVTDAERIAGRGL